MVSHDRFTGLLAGATMGVYALVLAGATTTVTDAAGACRTWPTCGGQWLALGSVDLLVVRVHRLLAVVVGLLVLVAAVAAWRRGESLRVRGLLAGVLALYPVQVGVGALAAVAPPPWPVRALHLGLGATIFAGLLGALALVLRRVTPEDDRIGAEGDPATAVADEAATPRSPDSGPYATVRAYLRLTKPRLMWLLCLVAAAGMALAAGPDLAPSTVAYTLGGGVLAIGASGTFNNVFERDVDRRMARTADRPVATETVPARNALAFGVVLAAGSLVALLQVNVLAAGLGAIAIVYYSVVYTLVLKPNTVQNTVVGGFAGSLPALIGWAAVTGRVGLPGLALAGVIFLWTPAHFYNLAMAYREDYERGGFPMLPVVRGEAVALTHVLAYLGATLLAATALAAVTSLGLLYAAASVLVGAIFLWAVVRLHHERTKRAALRSFHASNAYLGAVLVAVVLDSLLV